MRTNPINLILFSIAVADILLMVEYIPFTVHMYIMEQQNTRTREEQVPTRALAWVRAVMMQVHGEIFTFYIAIKIFVFVCFFSRFSPCISVIMTTELMPTAKWDVKSEFYKFYKWLICRRRQYVVQINKLLSSRDI